MDMDLNKSIDDFVRDNEEALFRDIARLVAVKSVQGEPEPGAPFGPGPARALALGLEIAEELGLAARSCEDMMGYAQLGEGEGDYLATVTHLDVVPAGEGWSGDPFVMRERDGYIIGRGVMDDKGPSVLCLYALKFLRQSGVKLRYPIRALLGINEENGMADLEHYLENYPAPLFCFSPDAGFPLCNGEKGIFHCRLVSTSLPVNIIDINGGLAVNAVPDRCEATVISGPLQSSPGVTAVKEDGLWRLTAVGVGGHASEPEHTVNAIGVMVDYLLENDVVKGDERAFIELLSRVHRTYDGSAVGIAADDGRFSPLTVVGGVIGVKDGSIFQTVDCRYPTNTDAATIAARLRAEAGDAARLIEDRAVPPFYISAETAAVRVCMDTYNLVTGEDARPFTMGGGTYARHFPNAVSFGPEHKDRAQPDFAGPIHGADEAACKEYFTEALRIYILTLLELEKLDF